MRKLQPHFLAVVIVCSLAAPLALMVPMAMIGCGTISSSQPLSVAATNAFPRTVATIDGLKVVADNSTNTALVTAVDLAAAVAIGGLGVWAKITHGKVADNSAAIAAQSQNQNTTTKPTT